MSMHSSARGAATLLSRRRFVTGIAAGGALAGFGLPAVAGSTANRLGNVNVLSGNTFELAIGETPVNFTGQSSTATAVNGSVPAPVLHWREGDTVTLRVTNRLPVTSSIHWHGVLLPFGMDGVPGLSFDGIQPGETFTYRFDANRVAPIGTTATRASRSRPGSMDRS